MQQFTKIRARMEKEILNVEGRWKIEKIMDEEGHLTGVEANVPFLGQVHLSFAPDHPFRPPRICVKGQRLHDALGEMTSQQYRRYSELFGGDCPCCDLSFMNKNWSPAITLLNILSRIQEMIHRRHHVIYEDCVNEILARYNLPEHLPILDFI